MSESNYCIEGLSIRTLIGDLNYNGIEVSDDIMAAVELREKGMLLGCNLYSRIIEEVGNVIEGMILSNLYDIMSCFRFNINDFDSSIHSKLKKYTGIFNYTCYHQKNISHTFNDDEEPPVYLINRNIIQYNISDINYRKMMCTMIFDLDLFKLKDTPLMVYKLKNGNHWVYTYKRERLIGGSRMIIRKNINKIFLNMTTERAKIPYLFGQDIRYVIKQKFYKYQNNDNIIKMNHRDAKTMDNIYSYACKNKLQNNKKEKIKPDLIKWVQQVINDRKIKKKYIDNDELVFYKNYLYLICEKIKGTEYDPNNYGKIKKNNYWVNIECIVKDLDKQGFVLNGIKNTDMFTFIHSLITYCDLVGLELKSEIIKLWNIILEKKIQHTIFIKNIISELEERYIDEMKHKGYLLLHSLANLLGYNVDDINEKDILDQLDKWRKEEYLPISKRIKQRLFFRKYWKSFLNLSSYIDNVKYSNEQIIKMNFNGIDTPYQALGNKLTLFNAAGSSKFKIQENTEDYYTTIRLNKSQFFSIIDNYNDIYKDSRKIVSKEDNASINQVIIKREFIKQRTVVNTSINTYVPLCKIDKIIERACKGIEQLYTSQTKEQKSELYTKFSKYQLMFNEGQQSHIQFPLDYSQFDRSISIDVIEEAIECMAQTIGGEIGKYLIDEFTIFKEILLTENIEYNRKDGVKYVFKYDHGVLSGWKITNIIETLINAVITYGIIYENKDLNWNDGVTMGDDVMLDCIIESKRIWKLEEILKDISKQYDEIGFIVNHKKNTIGINFNEFLRTAIYPGLVKSYPLRAVPSLYYKKPIGKLQYNDLSNFENNINDLITLTGMIDSKDKLLVKMSKLNNNPRIRYLGSKYFRNRNKYNIRFKQVTHSKPSWEKTKVLFHNSFIYQEYLKILKVSFPYISQDLIEAKVFNYFRNVKLSDRQTVMIVEELPDSIRKEKNRRVINQNTLDIVISSTLSQNNHNSLYLNIGDFEFSEIVKSILHSAKFSLPSLKFSLMQCYFNYIVIGGMKENKRTTQVNIQCLNSCKSKNSIISRFDLFKVPLNRGNFSAIVFSRVRRLMSRNIDLFWYYYYGMDANSAGRHLDYLSKEILMEICGYYCTTMVISNDGCYVINYQAW